ncbi:hypothetical protein C0J52_19317 [Blattella germanica]|nr:hypothetical protein C0J52_19317 [Blattella germanica]
MRKNNMRTLRNFNSNKVNISKIKSALKKLSLWLSNASEALPTTEEATLSSADTARIVQPSCISVTARTSSASVSVSSVDGFAPVPGLTCFPVNGRACLRLISLASSGEGFPGLVTVHGGGVTSVCNNCKSYKNKIYIGSNYASRDQLTMDVQY